MFSSVRDSIGRILLVVFLTKPVIDLTVFLSFNLGGVRISALHVFAGLLFFVLLPFRFQLGRNSPPYLILIEVFIGLHIVAMAIGFGTNSRLTLAQVIDFMPRILDWYLIYVTAFLAAIRHRYRDVAPFFKAIVLGSSIAIVANIIAVLADIDLGVLHRGGMLASGEFRRSGLYSDAGVLAAVAFFHLVFTVFLLHLRSLRGRWLITGLIIVLIMGDLYLIAMSKSRAVMVELALFGAVYIAVFQKGLGKILAPIAAAAVIGAALLVFDINMEDLFVRFDSDVAALESGADFEIGAGGEVSLGGLEGIGSNRGVLWALALTRILKRSALELLFGNFSTSGSHSDYLDVVARTGVIGLLVYLAFLIGLTIRSWRLSQTTQRPQDRALYFMGFTLLLCYLFYSIPFRPLGYTTLNWYMWAVIGLGMARARLAPLEAAALRRQKQAEDQPAGEKEPDEPPDIRPARRPHPAA